MTKPKILLLYSHPYPRQSKINQILLQTVSDLEHVTVRRLYECYPDFFIDIALEQQLLVDHDVIVLQHPMYWYSAPALTKQWLDVVLQHGFAYGSEGTTRLDGKEMLIATSTGSPEDTYQTAGINRYPVTEFLRPFEQTARLCRMIYRTPFVVQSAFRLSSTEIIEQAARYRRLLDRYQRVSEHG